MTTTSIGGDLKQPTAMQWVGLATGGELGLMYVDVVDPHHFDLRIVLDRLGSSWTVLDCLIMF